MKAIKILLLTVIFCFGGKLALSQDIETEQEVDLDTIGNYNVPSPNDVAKAQLPLDREVQYMLDNYSLPQLAQYAVQINKSQIAAAKRSGREVPAKLTKEILSDREKIGEYLRSIYRYRYQ